MIAGLLLSMMLAGPAMAQGTVQQDARAREWFINGQHLYQEGRYRDALVAFEAAYRMSSRPNVLRSIAYCHENLGEIGRALDVLYRYRGLAEEGKVADIERHIERLERRLEEETVPRPVVVPQPNSNRQSDTKSSPKPTKKEPSRNAQQQREIAPRDPWRVSLGPTIGYGLGGVALVTGGVFAMKAQQARASALDLCSDGARYCPRSAAKHINDDAFYSLMADTSFAVGGLALVGATVWMVVDNRQTSSVQVVPFGRGLGLTGRF